MAYLGLVPSEYSSGRTRRQGGIKGRDVERDDWRAGGSKTGHEAVPDLAARARDQSDRLPHRRRMRILSRPAAILAEYAT